MKPAAASTFAHPAMSSLGETDEAQVVDEQPAWQPHWDEVDLEQEILAVLDAPPQAHEQIAFAFQRKENELRVLFDRLTLEDSRELLRRLTLRVSGDCIADRMERLNADRRARLIAFLGDARRREAIRGARSGFSTTRTVARLGGR
jgi:hypothetical protein